MRQGRQILLPHDGWSPREHQLAAWQALRNPKIKTAVLAWHRRAGKDDVALHDAAIRMVNRVGNYWHMLPVQEQARRAIWEAVNPHTGRVRWMDAFPEDMIKHVDNQTMKLTMKNGATWQVLGSDNYNSLVGTTPIHITLSEAALADPSAYAFFRPILLENNGTSLHISSTRGNNHFKSLFDTLKGDSRAFVQLLSAHDSGVFTQEQLQEEYRFYVSLWGQSIGEALFRQEYLSDWNASNVGAVWGKELTAIRDEGRAAPFAYDSRFPVHTGWDIGVGDETVILFFQQKGNQHYLIDWYAANNLGIDHFAEVLAERPYYYGKHYAPHDVKERQWGVKGAVSRIDAAKEFGIFFTEVPNTAKSVSLATTSKLLENLYVNVQENLIQGLDGNPIGKDNQDDCEFILDTLGEYRFNFNKKTRTMSTEPLHNWASHYADALATYAVGSAKSLHATRGRAPALHGRTVKEMPRVKTLMHRLTGSTHRTGW